MRYLFLLLLTACANNQPTQPVVPPKVSLTVPTPSITANNCTATTCTATITWLPYGPFEDHKGGAKYIVWTYLSYHENDTSPGVCNYIMVGQTYTAQIEWDATIPHYWVALNAYWKDQPDDPLSDLVHYSPIGQRVILK